MPLPPDVETCTVNVGTPFGLTGRTGFVHVVIRPLFGGTASRLIWTATGDPFESWAENLPSPNGGRAPTVSLEIPYSDQPGFRDPAGNAVTMWPYQMTVTTFDPNGVQTGITTKEFTPLTTGPSVLDFDLIISEGEAAPVTGGSPVVLFVNGHSGPSVNLTKADVGLPLVNNTADSAKPVSAAQAAADTAVRDFAVQRSKHTGTQLSATISDFVTAVEAVAGRVLVVDNGDGTVSVTTSGGGFVLTDNGDGTATMTLDGTTVTVGNAAALIAAVATEASRAASAETALQNLTNPTFLTALDGEIVAQTGTKGRPSFDLTSFGGDPTGTTDSTPAWNTMLATIVTMTGVRGAKVTAFGNFKFLTAPNQVTIPLHIQGAGGPMTSSTRAGTLFNFPTADTAGLDFGVNASKFVLENIYLKGAGSVAGIAHGINAKCRGHYRNVVVEGFTGHGWNLNTLITGTPHGNCNNSSFDACRAFSNLSDGYHLEGTDCNVITFVNGTSAVSNGGWGLYNGNNTQHNVAVGLHCDSNTLGPIYDDGKANQYIDPYDEHAGECYLGSNSKWSVWHIGGTTSSPTIYDSSSGANSHYIIKAGRVRGPLVVGTNSTSPNLLTDAQSIPTASGFWTGQSNGSVSFATTPLIDGLRTVQYTSAASGNMHFESGFIAGVVQLEPYTITARSLAGSVGRQVRLEAAWQDAAGNTISTPTGALVTNDTATATTVTFSGTAPAGATQVRVIARVLATGGAGEVHSFNQFKVGPTTVPTVSIDPATYAVTAATTTATVALPKASIPTLIRPRAAQTLSSNGAVTIDASAGDAVITLAANATSSTITNPRHDQNLRITWIQDATGGRTYTWPSNVTFVNAAPTDTTANKRISALFRYDYTSSTWYELSAPIVAATLAPQVDTFTTSGTWTKPSGAVRCDVVCIGAGGGGGSGRRGAAGAVRAGGGSGGGGLRSVASFLASDLGATETVTVGAGGSGGAAQTVDSTDGNAGSAGANSAFGAAGSRWVNALPGNGGAGGAAAAAAGGGIAGPGASVGQASSATGLVGVSGNSTSGKTTTLTAGGGGSGGGITTGNVDSAGGSGSAPLTGNTGSTPTAGAASTGTAGGSAPAPKTGTNLPGGGGAGGGSSSVSAAGGGGAGSTNGGGGGGGGGASLNGNNSGAGGPGGDGLVQVTTYFN